MRHTASARALLAGALLAGVLAAAGPATASALSPNVTAMRAATTSTPGATTSSNWSGYIDTGATYTTVSASWTEPSVTCEAPNAAASFWVGLDGVLATSNTVEQTGTMVACPATIGAAPTIYAFWEAYPATVQQNWANSPVAPGDAMSASVKSGARGAFTLTVADATRGWSRTTTIKVIGARLSSAEVIAEAPSSSSGQLPLAQFGAVTFTKAMINTALLTATTAGAQAVTMVKGGVTMAVPSIVSAGTFSSTWQHG